MESIAISGEKRVEMGKKSTKAIRAKGQVPCVIYGGEKNVHFSSDESSFKSLVYTAEFKTATITVDGKEYPCIVKDIQFNPVTDQIQHIDFIELVAEQPVKISLPILLKGQSKGVLKGGAVTQKLRKVLVKTTPENMISAVYVDISKLDLGQSVRVEDIETNDGLEILSEESNPIASVAIPRVIKTLEEEEAEAAAEAAEGEEGEEGEEGAEGKEGGEES